MLWKYFRTCFLSVLQLADNFTLHSLFLLNLKAFFFIQAFSFLRYAARYMWLIIAYFRYFCWDFLIRLHSTALDRYQIATFQYFFDSFSFTICRIFTKTRFISHSMDIWSLFACTKDENTSYALVVYFQTNALFQSQNEMAARNPPEETRSQKKDARNRARQVTLGSLL